jgi:hypothetical protein
MRDGDWPRHEYGTHALRRTKASMIYKATGNLRAVQILTRADEYPAVARDERKDMSWRYNVARPL